MSYLIKAEKQFSVWDRAFYEVILSEPLPIENLINPSEPRAVQLRGLRSEPNDSESHLPDSEPHTRQNQLTRSVQTLEQAISLVRIARDKSFNDEKLSALETIALECFLDSRTVEEAGRKLLKILQRRKA
ncbi:hypothetical protein [Hydrogenobacter thermophilus]|uniref:hypothetical protein n=1 Tax=Hydrogenobacter thermophilus TaxID=940 RepID=UPI0030F96F90